MHSLEHKSEVIPYFTSYYHKTWGFCISHKERMRLQKGKYRVFIDSKHDENGVLNYADFVIPSTQNSKEEILLSTYLCHPSMANNELSGPVVAIFLANWLKKLKKRRYNYRFVIVPETIGSIVYIHKNLKHLKKNVKAGFILSCIGDDRAYSLIHSPNADTLSDKVALHTLKDKDNFKAYDFLARGSDERQYNSPLVNLGVVGICRSKYGEFEEYHTSKDDLDCISPEGLAGGLRAMQEICLNLENNRVYKSTHFCEPQLSKRKLYPTINIKNEIPILLDFIALCDGKMDCLDIANRLKIQAFKLENIIEKLLEHKLIKELK